MKTKNSLYVDAFSKLTSFSLENADSKSSFM